MKDTWSLFQIKQLLNRTQHEWHRVNIFTRWLAATQQTVILVFDAPAPIGSNLPSPFLRGTGDTQLADPFWVYVNLMEGITKLEDDSVWTIRDRIREIETHRTPSGKPSPDYRGLHDTARHAIHVTETLDVAEKTMISLLAEHQDLMTNATDPIHASKDIQRRLLFFEHVIVSLRHRSASNKERLLNEIQLAYNTVAQYDAGVSVRVGQAAQLDSAAMKTVAFATLIFLPPTFISAVFSTSFFAYDPGSGAWLVSDMFWLYWAVAIPTTVVTSLLWYLWRKANPLELVGAEAEVEAVDTRFADAKASLLRGINLLSGGGTDA